MLGENGRPLRTTTVGSVPTTSPTVSPRRLPPISDKDESIKKQSKKKNDSSSTRGPGLVMLNSGEAEILLSIIDSEREKISAPTETKTENNKIQLLKDSEEQTSSTKAGPGLVLMSGDRETEDNSLPRRTTVDVIKIPTTTLEPSKFYVYTVFLFFKINSMHDV